jgi:pimaricinolide synthase PimS1
VHPLLATWHERHADEATVDSWRYRVDWAPLVLASAPDGYLPAHPSGRWLAVVPGNDPWAEAVATALAERVDLVITTRNDLGALGSFAGVVAVLAPGDPDPLPGFLALVQALGDVPLWCVTNGAVAVGPADEPADPATAQVWGLGRVAALELPRAWGGLVDLPTEIDGHVADRFAAVLAGEEDQVAVRASGAFGRRLRRAPGGPVGQKWRPGGTVLVTGGTGGLGVHVARWLAGAGAERLLLTNRRGLDADGAQDLAIELTALGAKVDVVACDAADRDALARVP